MENFKILGQAISTAATPVELYAVPVTSASSAGSSVTFTRSYDPPTQTLVTSIIVCNQNASSERFFDLMLFDSASGETGSSIAAKNYLLKAVSLAAKETKVLSLGLTMSARSNSATPSTTAKGDILQFSVDTGTDVSVTAMGIEIT